MAKIIEENIVIKISKLVKDPDSAVELTNADLLQNFEAIAQELVGNSVIVEVYKAE